MRKLGETVLDVDSATLKKLITKLDNLEKSLRELRRLQGGRIIPMPKEPAKIKMPEPPKAVTPPPKTPSPILIKKQEPPVEYKPPVVEQKPPTPKKQLLVEVEEPI